MKNLLLISTILLTSHFLFAQQKTEAYFGVQNYWESARDIIELYDKGFFVLGGMEGEEFNKGWYIKTDINFGFIYDKIMEHILCTVAPQASITDDDGNIYITGFTTYPGQWPFVTKLDSCGNKIWCKILNYEEEFTNGWSNDIVLTGNEEVVVLSTLINDEQPADQINMTHLIGLSNEGEVLWKKPFASRINYSWIRQPLGYSIEKINYDYYISGFCYWPYPDDTTHFFLRPLFIGIDSLFEEKWILPYYALDSVFGEAFKTIPLNDSVFMGVGVRRAYSSSNEDNAILMFYNKDGEKLGYNEIYNEQIGPDFKGSDIRNIVRINDTLFMTSSQFGPDFSANPIGELIIDTAANVYNFLSHPNCLGFRYGLIKTSDDNYSSAVTYSNGYPDWDIYVYKIDANLNDVPFDPTPHTYDSLCPGGIQSGTIDLTGCFVWTNIGGAPSPKEYYESIRKIPVKAYPNPVSGSIITFEFENTEHHRNIELRCFNIYGEAVYSEKVYRYQEKSEVEIATWRNGLYVVVVYSEGLAAGRCKFVVNH